MKVSAALLTVLMLTAHIAGAASKRLNTLVGELAIVADIRAQAADFTPPVETIPFERDDEGWVYIRALPGDDCGPMRLTLDNSSADQPILTLPGQRLETMRYVTAGKHMLRIRGRGTVALREVVVRAVPEILVYMVEHLEKPRPAMFYSHPRDFLETAILPHCNTVVSPPKDHYAAMARQWRAAGGHWLINHGFHTLRDPEADLATYWKELLGRDWVDGTIHDELLRPDLQHVLRWDPVFGALKRNPVLAGKHVYLFSMWTVPSAQFAQTFQIVEGETHSGRRALQCNSASRLLNIRQQKIMLTPGQRYTLSAWIKAEGLKFGVIPGNDGYDGAYTGLFIIDTGWFTTHGLKLRPPEGSRGWQRYSQSFTAHKSRDGLYELIVCAPGHGRLWIDDIQLEEGETRTDYVETAPGGKATRNLLVNGGLEYAFEGWQQYVAEIQRLARVLQAQDVRLAPECYVHEFANEAKADSELKARLSAIMGGWKALSPGIERQMTLILSAGNSAPRYSNDKNPAVNYKVHLDRQFHLIANDSVFEGLRGVGFWSMHYLSPELVRWYGKLYRHYLIEGRTDRLCHDPYDLVHLRNGGFEKGLSGWNTATSGTDAIAVVPWKGLLSRYVHSPAPERTHILTLRRHGKTPNRLTQSVLGLTAGRLYSLKVYTAAPGAKENSLLREETLLDIRMDGGDILPQYTETRLWQNLKTKAFWTMHTRVFQAVADPATLILEQPGNAKAPELLYLDFVQIEPFAAEN